MRPQSALLPLMANPLLLYFPDSIKLVDLASIGRIPIIFSSLAIFVKCVDG